MAAGISLHIHSEPHSVLVIVNPSAEVLDIGALSALAGALGFALAMIVVRRLSVTDSVACISFWFTVPSLAITAALIVWPELARPQPVPE